MNKSIAILSVFAALAVFLPAAFAYGGSGTASSMVIYTLVGSVLSILIGAYFIMEMKALSPRLIVVGIVLMIIGNLIWLYGDLAAGLSYSYAGIGVLVLGILIWIVGDYKGGAFAGSRIKSLSSVLIILGTLLAIAGTAIWIYGDFGGGYNYIYGGFGVIVLGIIIWIIGDYRSGMFVMFRASK